MEKTETKTIAVVQDCTIRGLVTKMKDQFALALPKHITPDRFLRIALTAINKNPRLMECTKESMLACLLDCSQLGLEPDGRKAHLIPYRDKQNSRTICTLIIDYKGMVELARRSGEISDIHADVICKNDVFDYSYGTDGTLTHKPCLNDRGDVVGAYSFVKLKDGSMSYEVMGLSEIDAVRKRSKAAASGPWVSDWREMAKKTVFRRHSKWLPMSSEYMEAVEKDYDTPEFDAEKVTVDIPNPFAEEAKQIDPAPTVNEAYTGDPAQLTEEEKREYGL